MNTKAILVVDMPSKCESCPCSTINEEIGGEMVFTCDALPNKEITETNMTKRKPSWCPLKPMPQKKSHTYDDVDTEYGIVEGWNECLEELEKC